MIRSSTHIERADTSALLSMLLIGNRCLKARIGFNSLNQGISCNFAFFNLYHSRIARHRDAHHFRNTGDIAECTLHRTGTIVSGHSRHIERYFFNPIAQQSTTEYERESNQTNQR